MVAADRLHNMSLPSPPLPTLCLPAGALPAPPHLPPRPVPLQHCAPHPSAPSFAIVIQQLPQPLRDAVCVFYLVLRGLDTVEDDMAISDKVKIPELLAFHKKIYDP